MGFEVVVTGAADGAEGDPFLGNDAEVEAESLELVFGFGDVGKGGLDADKSSFWFEVGGKSCDDAVYEFSAVWTGVP